ncbi:TetR/AcrR family transcriptional regulator [Streptomyces sp. NPDC047525]|uniref:TetR/AcrR family transcriptional regulator n=1 Tax=Streptomyces sp. NPDC047525 TaxID=3155264 RepID=UPI0033DD3A97
MTQEDSLRERLIDVGVDIVMTDGAASLGLREIARRAGVSHGAPRRHFATHHALLSAIARRGFEDLEARFEIATGRATSPRGQLEALARTYVGYALAHRGMFELMFRHDLLDSGQHPSDADHPRLRESTLPLFDGIVGLVARCRTEQEAADRSGARSSALPPPPVVAAALWANLHGIAQLWAWDSMQLALDSPSAGGSAGRDHLDGVVAAALDAHLGPAAV